jgi:hypothetical protein
LFLALVAVGQTGASYDADGQRLEARGAAAADLRAPNAQVARVKAERSARAQAERRLRAAVIELTAKKLDDEVLAKVLEAATVSEQRFGSDGSVELKLLLSTKALDLKR